MKSRYDGYNWILVLEKGELLINSLTKFATEEDIHGGFLTGLGGAMWAEVGIYDLQSKTYKWKKLEKALEITALQGNLAWKDNQPIWHIHGTFSDDQMQALGGHVKELQVAGTLELFLHVIISGGLQRKHSDQIGLDLLEP